MGCIWYRQFFAVELEHGYGPLVSSTLSSPLCQADSAGWGFGCFATIDWKWWMNSNERYCRK